MQVGPQVAIHGKSSAGAHIYVAAWARFLHLNSRENGGVGYAATLKEA